MPVVESMDTNVHVLFIAYLGHMYPSYT